MKHSVQQIKDICWRSIKYGNIRNNITLFANVLSFLSKMQLCNLLIKMCNSPGIRRNEIDHWNSSIPESRFTMRFFEAVRWVNQFESLPDITQAINLGVMHKFYKVGTYLVQNYLKSAYGLSFRTGMQLGHLFNVNVHGIIFNPRRKKSQNCYSCKVRKLSLTAFLWGFDFIYLLSRFKFYFWVLRFLFLVIVHKNLWPLFWDRLPKRLSIDFRRSWNHSGVINKICTAIL